ncbi:MAG: oxidoreductase [Pirellulaceae bacterium]|nr:MAG: oxidoreductase [Pirellulaceae bacterium]GIX01004.1 MAG: oxidoreductase [Pirellulaceae bacterium]
MDELLPELGDNPPFQIRIPGEVNVGVTRRVLRLLDTPAMQRLKRISQLGLVTHVYPGATHTRFEHSLGVYRLACMVLRRLQTSWRRWREMVTGQQERLFLLAALMHDIGHWPYCHPIEDLGLAWAPRHEELARRWLCHGEVADLLRRDWEVEPDAVADFLASPRQNVSLGESILRSMLNGPVDIDKMDYLQRDSLHAGVPYGQNFDLLRLIGALTVDEQRRSLAITEKGKTAAEMLVFGRYVMFSEVYWHHAVRSATAMLQRLVYHLGPHCDTTAWREWSDVDFVSRLGALAAERRPELLPLHQGIFSIHRRLYKRVLQFNHAAAPDLYHSLARCEYSQLDGWMVKLAERLAQLTGRPWSAWEVLIDAPPAKLEVQFDVRVALTGGQGDRFVSLAQVSPVVQTLATEQFDQHVKRVRVFVAPDRVAELAGREEQLMKTLDELIQSTS